MLTNLISVVDDDASVCKTTTLPIARGFPAPGFESSELFPKSGQLHETSWLIVDVRMPAMNGVHLQSHLAALGCEIPIIFFTAYQDKASRRGALQAGGVTFLGKPFSDELVLQARSRTDVRIQRLVSLLIRGLQEIPAG